MLTSVDRGVSRGQRGGSPTVVNLSFLDRRIACNALEIRSLSLMNTSLRRLSDLECITTAPWKYAAPEEPMRKFIAPVEEVIMKNGVFWDVTPCGSCKNRSFKGT
jgi:hypothetical protein